MLVGYARISTQEQTLALQQDALHKAGCDKVFTDTISGATQERNGLAQALNFVRNGDTLVVWKLDRLGRSLKNLIETVTLLHNKGVGFKSLTEQIDTTTSGGKLIFHVFGALAEFERDLIRERTQAGLEAARARGKLGGRPTLLDEKKRKLLLALYADKSNGITDILSALHISKSTLYRYVKNVRNVGVSVGMGVGAGASVSALQGTAGSLDGRKQSLSWDKMREIAREDHVGEIAGADAGIESEGNTK